MDTIKLLEALNLSAEQNKAAIAFLRDALAAAKSRRDDASQSDHRDAVSAANADVRMLNAAIAALEGRNV